MVLDRSDNPTTPAFVTKCNICHLDIETGQGWRCETCPDYNVCNACYEKDGGIDHPHKLKKHPSIADPDAQNKEARQLRVEQLCAMLDLLMHTSQCRSPHCQYPRCWKVKELCHHVMQCTVHATGGCDLCKKAVCLLQLHVLTCEEESQCPVSRCREMKDYLKKVQLQSNSYRQAITMEIRRHRAAEVAGSAENKLDV